MQMSKLKKCRACGKEIAKRSVCAYCGEDNRNFFIRHKILTVLAILSVAIIGFVTNAYVAGQAIVVVLVVVLILGSIVDSVKS